MLTPVTLTEQQFAALLEKLSVPKEAVVQNSFTHCTARYNGDRNVRVVDEFITTSTIFKECAKISDCDALKGLPLLLTGDAATWWQGVKNQAATWKEATDKIKQAFAPKRPEYRVYMEIFGKKQDKFTPTDTFIFQKRALLAEIPDELTEKIQLDMVYGLLDQAIRDRTSRESVKTFTELIEQARKTEESLREKRTSKEHQQSQQPDQKKDASSSRNRCKFCKRYGHQIQECRKKKAADETTTSEAKPATEIACYGCKKPGVIRSKCPNCNPASSTAAHTALSPTLDFCTVGAQGTISLLPFSRPSVDIQVDQFTGTAFIDTGARVSVAGHQLYQLLVSQGYNFKQQAAVITLADGSQAEKVVKSVRVPVTLNGRKTFTTFVVLPGAVNRTLLGVDFVVNSGMVMNLQKSCWHYADAPHEVHQFQDREDVHTTSLASFGPIPSWDVPKLEEPKYTSETMTTPLRDELEKNVTPTGVQATLEDEDWNQYKKTLPIPELLSPLSETPNHFSTELLYEKSVRSTPTPNWSPQLWENFGISTITVTPTKGRLSHMMRDAQMAIHLATETSVSRDLFPTSPKKRKRPTDLHICSLDLQLRPDEATHLAPEQRTQLNALLDQYSDLFEPHGPPTHFITHRIDTGDHAPCSVPPYRMTPAKQQALKKEIDDMLEANIIEECESPWAALLQGEGVEERPVEYASRLLTPAERNYSTTEREALAIVWSIDKFRGYIEETSVVVVTDHQPLKWLMTLKTPSGRLARWGLKLQPYNLQITYAPG